MPTPVPPERLWQPDVRRRYVGVQHGHALQAGMAKPYVHVFTVAQVLACREGNLTILTVAGAGEFATPPQEAVVSFPPLCEAHSNIMIADT